MWVKSGNTILHDSFFAFPSKETLFDIVPKSVRANSGGISRIDYSARDEPTRRSALRMMKDLQYFVHFF